MVLLQHIPQPDFGSFAFLLGFAAFSWAAWQSVFCAPLPETVNAVRPTRRVMIERVSGSANLLTALGASPLFFAVPLLVGLNAGSACFFAAFALISLVRWFGRAHAYLYGDKTRAVASDWLYSVCLLASVVLLVLSGEVTMTHAYLAMTISALVGLVPFGAELFRVSTAELARKPLARWVKFTRSRSSWSLAAVVCGELASNAHAYIVLIFAGSTSYAPIAATALLVRPIAFASVAVQDVERPRLAHLIKHGGFREAKRNIRWSRGVLGLAWVLSCAAVAALFAFDPHLLFPREYDWTVLLVGSLLWLLVSALVVLRVPEIALLQAVGHFREIAAATAKAAAVSTFAALVLVLTAGPVWSIAGIFAGRLVNAYLIALTYRRWRRNFVG